MKSIDLVSFLTNYYCIYHPAFNNKKLSHDDIKILFPFIETINYFDNNDLVKGDIIGVYDKNRKIAYYVNPRISEVIADYEVNNSNEKISIPNLDNLSKYELLNLRRKLRLNNQRKESYLINKVIRKIKRKEPRDYKKRKLLVKESFYD